MAHPYGPEVRAALTHFRRPLMSGLTGEIPAYAFFSQLGSLSRGRTFTRLADLVDHIHSRRGERSIELEEATLAWRDGTFTGVTVWLRDSDGLRSGFLGYAWLGGRGRHALEAALHAAKPCRIDHTLAEVEAA